jgi:hypothetical protein
MKRRVERRTLALLIALALGPAAVACTASASPSAPGAAVAGHCPGVDAEAVRCRDD